MGIIEIKVRVNDGEGASETMAAKATSKDIAMAITQLEMRKKVLIENFEKGTMNWTASKKLKPDKK